MGRIDSSDQRERGLAEILDRGALPEELRIRAHGKTVAVCEPGRGLDRWYDVRINRAGHHGAADHHRVPASLVAQRRADLLRDAHDVRQVDAAVRTARCADTDERDVAAEYRLTHIRGRGQAARRDPFGHQRGNALLDDGAAAGVDLPDLSPGNVDADDPVTFAREAGRGYAAHIAETEHTD